MVIEWDDRKADHNFKKHGISFEEAIDVFFDPLVATTPDAHPSQERMIGVGHTRLQKLLVVAYVERAPEGYRIISARRATSRERRDYEEGI